MATVRDLLLQTDFEEVWEVLHAADENAEQYRQTYLDLYNLLRGLEPDTAAPQMTIRLEEAFEPWILLGDEEADNSGDAEDAEEAGTLQLSGYLPGDEDAYAIGVRPPAQIVAMAVDPETLAGHSPAEILANCIAEITWSRTTAENIWSPKLDTLGGGLYAAENCAEKDMGGGLSVEALRREMGLTEEKEEEEEDYKSKYGFLF